MTQKSHPLKVGALIKSLASWQRSYEIDNIFEYEIWIEDVRRVGPITEDATLKHIGYDDQDFLQTSVCTGIDTINKRIYINHHI